MNLLIRVALTGVLILSVCACSYRKLAVNGAVSAMETSLSTFEHEFDDVELFEKGAPATLLILEMLLTHDRSEEDASS